MTVAQEALAAAAAGTEAVYVSVDLGVIEGVAEPGRPAGHRPERSAGIVARVSPGRRRCVWRGSDGGLAARAAVLAARLVGDLVLAVGGGRG